MMNFIDKPHSSDLQVGGNNRAGWWDGGLAGLGLVGRQTTDGHKTAALSQKNEERRK